MFVTKRPNCLQILSSKRPYSALTLQRFAENGTGLVANELFNLLWITKPGMGKAGRQRFEPLVKLGLAGCSNRGQSPAMKGTGK